MEKPSEIDSQTHFGMDLERRLGTYFSKQKKLSTITIRAIRFSLIDFPIIVLNFPFIVGSILIRSLQVIYRNSDRLEKTARWMTQPKNRNSSWANLLPPYRTFSARSKLKSFKRMVFRPLEEQYAISFRTQEMRKMEDILLDPLTRWEKVPNLLENILTVPFWVAGIKFLGLDPKTVFVLSRDKDLYKHLSLSRKGFFESLYIKARWIFGVSIPWSYSLKLVAVGLIVYILLMILIEYISVQFYYRDGIEKKLLEQLKSFKS